MKIIFNPSIKPFVTKSEKITCPKCGSSNVWTHTIVHAWAWVHLNTAEVEEPEDGEADLEDAREQTDRLCNDCHHEWEKKESGREW